MDVSTSIRIYFTGIGEASGYRTYIWLKPGNTYMNVTHSVIDFYSANVESLLSGVRACGEKMNGVCEFFDPDRNSLVYDNTT